MFNLTERSDVIMKREETYREIEGVFGLVPGFFKVIPENTLDLEWQLFKKIQLEDGLIPGKYRELMGLAMAAATKCRYCVAFHTEIAKLNGASEEEIEEALHFAKETSSWSTYINGLQLDFDEFKAELKAAVEYVHEKQLAAHV